MADASTTLQEQLDRCEQRLAQSMPQRGLHVDLAIGVTSAIVGAAIFWYFRRDVLQAGAEKLATQIANGARGDLTRGLEGSRRKTLSFDWRL